MSFGGYHPYPRRFGGGRPRLQIIHDALNAARGTSLDGNQFTNTLVWIENHAYARAICFDGYGTNDRLAMQWDPERVTDMLSRWERIFKIIPSPSANAHDRRQVLKRRWRRFLHASATHARLREVLSLELGDYFVAIEYIGISHAVIHVPDETYPWGTVVEGYPWTSNVARVLILLQKPSGARESDFYQAASKVGPAIDGILPSWVTFTWYRAGANCVHPVVDGPSMAGFCLDNPANLDNNIFSE